MVQPSREALQAHLAEAEARLREAEGRLAMVVEATRGGVFELRAPAGHSGDPLSMEATFSEAYAALLGTTRDELAEAGPWADAIDPEDREHVIATLRHALRHRLRYEAEYRLLTKDGSYRWFRCRGVARFGGSTGPTHFVGTIEDVHDERTREAELRRRALHDDLTGLPNRASFLAYLERAMDGFRRRGSPFAVLFVDLDRFKQVNDTWGHDAGDQLLVEAASRLRAALRPSDVVARLHGDEFAVLLHDVEGIDLARAVVARLLRTLRNPFRIDVRGAEQLAEVSGSIGIALADPVFRSPHQVLDAADRAMYQAKADGRGRSIGPITRQKLQRAMARSA